MITVKAYNAEQRHVADFPTLPLQYKATTHYKRMTTGDAVAALPGIAYWELRDRFGHLIEKIKAPGF